MKTLFLFLLASCSLAGFSQSNTTLPANAWRPLYYLDSVKMDPYQLYFDLNKLAALNVDNNYRDSARHIQGKIFMRSKDPKGFHFLTMADLTSQYQKGAATPTLFMLDNTLLTDINGFKIDSSYILRVDLVRSSDIVYLKNTLPNLTIFKITTQKNGNKEQIMIRGGETTAMH